MRFLGLKNEAPSARTDRSAGARRFHGRNLALIGLVAFVSCFRGERPPEVAAVHTLSVSSPDGAAAGSTHPFGVVFASPSGETTDPTEITVVFNRPMRPLQLAGEESAPPIQIIALDGAPVPKGSFRWLGTSAIIFAPETRLARATDYAVVVPKGTRSLAGETLAEESKTSFSTPRPEVVRFTPADHPDRMLPTQAFELRFNQPVDLAEVMRAVSVKVAAKSTDTVEDGGATAKKVAFTASFPKPDTRALVKITPSSPLPLDRAIRVAVDATFRGTEGPRTTGTEQTFDRRTYAPLSAELSCLGHGPLGECGAHQGFFVQMNNRVPIAELKAHAKVAGASFTWPKSTSDKELDDTSYLNMNTSASRSYTVTMTAGMKDEFGQALKHDVTKTFKVDEEWPGVEIGLEGTVLEAGQPSRIPIGSMNVESVDVASAPLDEMGVVAFDSTRDTWRGERFDALASDKNVVKQHAGAGTRDVRTLHYVDVAELLSKSPAPGLGAVAFGYSAAITKQEHPKEVRLVTRTDLAISAKMSRFGSFVRVTRLSDGLPVAGATVAIREAGSGKEEVVVTTDDNGTATIAADKYNPIAESGETKPDLLFARSKGDWSYRRVDDMINGWRSGVSTDTSGRLTPAGMMFTDRGVYRPGETVKVKGLFREPLVKGTRTPVGGAISVDVTDSEGTSIFKTDTKLGAFGEFHVDVPVPATTHLGSLSINAELAGSEATAKEAEHEKGSANATVLLAAYKAAEFAVHVDPGQKEYLRGDKGMYTVRGDYLFGAPMSSGKVHFSATRGTTYFSPPGTEGLALDDSDYRRDLPDESPRATQIASGDGALDAKGSFEGTVPLALPAQHGAELVSIEADVQDLSRQTISAETTFLVHPGEFYLGLKGPDLFVEKGKNVHPTVIAVEPAGKKRRGVRAHLALVKRTWETVVEENGESGTHYESKTHDEASVGCDVTTSDAGPVGCDLAPPEAGYYVLRATATDPRKNEIASSTGLYVTGKGELFGWPMSDSKDLTLVRDKKTYQPGDTAKILVKNPFPHADAIVTVERAGVYHEEKVTLDGSMPVLSIPVTDDLRPNAFVSVHLVRGRIPGGKPGRGQDLGAPTYRLGYTEIDIDPEARRLKVGVTPNKKDYGPGEQVDVDLSLNDRAGKPVHGDVTFYAVDEGVLMLTGYKTPDPLPELSAHRSLNVFTLETREDLAKVIAIKARIGDDKGGEGGGGGDGESSVRQDFKATAFFASDVLTDGAGKAHVKFKLPDNLTTFRLMAVAAAEDDHFGFGDAQVTTSRPLMVRPELPRFLRAGDQWEASAIVTSKGLPEEDIEVSLRTEGANVQMGNLPATRTVHVPANGNVEVRWPLTTPDAGKTVFAFAAHAKDGRTKDEAKVARDITVPLSPEAVALYGETNAATAEELADISKVRKDFGGLDVRLASSALVGLDDGIQQLIDYPYGCTEQLTSRMVPLLSLRDLAHDYNIPLPVDLNAVVGPAMQKILANQHPDGGFGWWPDSQEEDPWLSAYALWGLHQARTHNVEIPDDAFDRAKTYVHNQLARLEDKRIDWPTKTFVLDVLAEIGDPDAGYMTTAYEHRADMPLFARAELAHAMVLGKMPADEVKELLRDVDAHVRLTTNSAVIAENLNDEYAPYIDSTAHTTAMVLRALLASEPNHPLGARLARGLLSMRDHGTWRSTQETTWSLIALDEYRRAQEKNVPSFEAKVFFGQDLLTKSEFQGRSVQSQSESFAMTKLAASGATSGGRLTFEKNGAGTLFYEARLRYSRVELPKDGLDRGFFVRKLVRAVKPGELPAALETLPKESSNNAGGGDLVLVDLLVVSADPHEQVVVDDPLPAGLEPVQMDFATTGAAFDVTEPGAEGDQYDADNSHDDARAADEAYTSAPYHREMHDDRVLTFVEHMPAGMFHYRYLARATTFGHFVVPPTRVECMYQPEMFGRTGATTFDVK